MFICRYVSSGYTRKGEDGKKRAESSYFGDVTKKKKKSTTRKAAPKIHDEIAKEGLLTKVVVLGTALVDMYAKCGALLISH